MEADKNVLNDLNDFKDYIGNKIDTFNELKESLEQDLNTFSSIDNARDAIRIKIIDPITSELQSILKEQVEIKKENEKVKRNNRRNNIISYTIGIIGIIVGIIGYLTPTFSFSKEKIISSQEIDTLFYNKYFIPKSNKSYILYSHRSMIPNNTYNYLMFKSQRFRFDINVLDLNTEYRRNKNWAIIDTINKVSIQFNLYNNKNILLNNSNFISIELKNKNSFFDSEKNIWHLSEGDEFYLLNVRYIIHRIYSENFSKKKQGVDIITLHNDNYLEILLNQNNNYKSLNHK